MALFLTGQLSDLLARNTDLNGPQRTVPQLHQPGIGPQTILCGHLNRPTEGVEVISINYISFPLQPNILP